MGNFKRVFDAGAVTKILTTLVICAMVQTSCSADTRLALSMTNPAMKQGATVVPTPRTNPTATPSPEVVSLNTSSPSSGSVLAAYPLLTLDETASIANIVAKVRLRSIASRAEPLPTGGPHLNGGRFFLPYMEFEFEVLEYLKGDGSDIIWGSVMLGHGFDTKQDALDAAAKYRNIRDNHIYSRWDNRDAIVFLYDVSASPINFHTGMVRQADTYLLGWMVVESDGYWWESYSVASGLNKNWLPAAQPSGVSGASGDAQQFLLDAPGGYAAGGLSGGVSGASGESAPTISLSALKGKIAAMEATPTPTPTSAPEPSPTPTP